MEKEVEKYELEELNIDSFHLWLKDRSLDIILSKEDGSIKKPSLINVGENGWVIHTNDYCPLFDGVGCTIQDNKPFGCSVYPIIGCKEIDDDLGESYRVFLNSNCSITHDWKIIESIEKYLHLYRSELVLE